MKWIHFLLLALVLPTIGCDMRKREKSLQQKEAALNEKEQQLLLKEKTLLLLEEELTKRKLAFDSTLIADTSAKINPALVGTWNAKMTCTETTCPGSAVGDTKTETWEISYQNKNVIAKAKVNEELVRVYSGIYTDNTLELVESVDNSVPSTTKIIVRLTIASESKLEGQREIERMKEKCRVIYSLTLDKK